VIVEDKLREKSAEFLHFFEAFLYVIVGALLSALAIGGVIQAVSLLWQNPLSKAPADYSLHVLDQLLLILMLVELLHTVRISVRSQALMTEPFLIVGLIASIRRSLVITMRAAKMTDQAEPQAAEAASVAFRNAMVELGLLGFLVIVFVFAIYLLRRSPSSKEPLVE
jgi:uncharacterized membrane protein (DUF373 family)